jgi:hypothetical protein
VGTRLTRFVCASLPVRVGRAWEIGFVPSLRVERFGGLFGFDAKGDGVDEVAGGLANGALEAGDAFEVFGAGPEWRRRKSSLEGALEAAFVEGQ